MIEHMLSDIDMQRFITHGYHLIRLTNVPDVHDEICRQTRRVFEGGNPQDKILREVPALERIFDHPRTRGALASILGPDYVMFSHRHCHLSPAGFAGGNNHQDGTERKLAGWHRPWRRHFRARTVMAIYYPHDVNADNGPTAVIPGSQYLGALSQGDESRELTLNGEAGSIAIVHFDIWHRATANISNCDRIMMKFLFKRVSEPRTPTWNGKGSSDASFPSDDSIPHMPLIWQDMWRWHRGRDCQTAKYRSSGTTDDLFARMASGDEITATNAAYDLGSQETFPGDALVRHLCDPSSPIRERVPLAMSAGGAAGTGYLEAALRHSDPWVRATAADTLGDIGIPSTAVLPSLASCLTDQDPWVRHNAAETMGVWGRQAESEVSRLTAALSDPEPFVRMNALTALFNIGRQHVTPQSMECLLVDPDYKVSHHAGELNSRAA